MCRIPLEMNGLFKRLKETILLWVSFVASVFFSAMADMASATGKSQLWANRKGVSTVGIIMVIVGAYMAGILLPTAIVAMSNATAYSGADSSVITIATVLLPILVIIGLALRFIKTR